jgi:transposase
MADIYNDLRNQALPLFDKLEPLDIKALIFKKTNGRMRIRLLSFLHIKEGANRAVTAIYLKSSRKAVNDWAKNFYENRLDGLKEKLRTGRPCSLTHEHLITFKECVIEHQT